MEPLIAFPRSASAIPLPEPRWQQDSAYRRRNSTAGDALNLRVPAIFTRSRLHFAQCAMGEKPSPIVQGFTRVVQQRNCERN